MNVVLTLDLPSTTSKASREEFYAQLRVAGFSKLKLVTTVWFGKFPSIDAASLATQRAAENTAVVIQKAFLFEYVDWTSIN